MTVQAKNTFLCGYAFRPHASNESDLRIWELLNPLSRVETFESDIFSDTCGRLNPDTFKPDDVARLGPVSTVVSTAWLQNNMAANQNVLAVLLGLISSLVRCSVKCSYVDCAFKLYETTL